MADKSQELTAIRFRQWIAGWDKLKFDEKEHRRKPSSDIFLFSMRAEQLRALSGVFRRQRDEGVATGIQRGHDKDRSSEIRDYVQFGYPYSDMSPRRRESFDADDLKKPGWLPTAIVVNVLTASDMRRGKKVEGKDLVKIRSSNGSATVALPSSFSGHDWEPAELHPIEIIDGQHRLYAFDGEKLPGDFELPVVAFVGLDLGWQAYLFWSINVSPKKINPSHAFDLYPLLRSQDWLEKFAESNVYREARAQELTEFLFRHSSSPWKGRINMLGERGVNGPSQAAWIRSLGSTFLSAGRGRAAKGLFGCNINDVIGPLPWTRPQQAALLIFLWQKLADAIKHTEAQWTMALRQPDKRQPNLKLNEGADLAFSGPHTILNQEQGVRGFLSISNDFLFHWAEELKLDEWEADDDMGPTTADDEVSLALEAIAKQPFASFVCDLANAVAQYDWRSSDAEQLTDIEKLKRRAFRGSGGYVALREDLLRELAATNEFGEKAKALQALKK